MTAIAPTVQGFFTERLAQRGVSAHTVAAYRDALRLLPGSQATSNSPKRSYRLRL